MRAAVLRAVDTPLAVEDVELSPPRAGEVLVRLAASGVCHSDLHTVQGVHPWPLPAVLGHEGAGVVEEVAGGVDGIEPGDHVVLSWIPFCGACRFCARGRPSLCVGAPWSEAGTMADGTTRLSLGGLPIHHYTSSTFAERTVVPAASVFPVPCDLPLVELSLLGCAAMTGLGAVLNTAGVRPGDSVAVVGCGGVGLFAVQAARIAGAGTVLAVDRAPGRLSLARELGATHVAEPADARSAAELAGGGFDHVIEAVGRPETIGLALELTGRGGQTVLVGMAAPETRIAVGPLTMTVEERAVRGSWYGSFVPERDLPRALELIRSGDLRLDTLVTRCALDDVNAAFEAMERGDGARPVIVF
jgi:Zn-dependent alcohol dehydrogenase